MTTNEVKALNKVPLILVEGEAADIKCDMILNQFFCLRANLRKTESASFAFKLQSSGNPGAVTCR
jgi:hypothetical protein